jgi:glutathione S-transferase
MKLYYHPLSGHSHRARLFLSLTGIPHELVEVDLAKGAHKGPDFLKLNRFGQVPVLDDNGTVIADSNAIMVYLAKTYGKSAWLPEAPAAAAAVQRWLSVAAGEIAYGPAAARLITVFGAQYNAEEVIARAHVILRRIDDALAGHDWIADANPTIADVALYGYVARAPEGNVDLSPYANIATWLARIEALPGFVPFQQTPVGLSAKQADRVA